MQILITGVPGWLGNRFLEILTHGYSGEGPLRPDWKIRCAVLPGSETAFIRQASPDIEVVFADITDSTGLSDACRGVDVLFHIAGIIHPPFRNVGRVFEVNTNGTRNLLSAAEAAGMRRFVFVSSNSPAGFNTSAHERFTEETPYDPYMSYGLSKYHAEVEVNNYQAAGKMETVILRPCWFYGPCQPERQTRFFKMIQKGNPIVFGNGQNLRSMSYVDNTCQGMILAATKDEAAGQTYWLADRRPYSMLEVYQAVAGLLGVKLRPRYLPGITADVCRLVDKTLQAAGLYEMNFHVAGEMNKNIACSVKKAEVELGYDPTVELNEGMRRSIAWCRKQGLLE